MKGRTYRYFEGEPLYAFGYGLSYTTFEYGEAKVSGSHKSMKLTVPVTNTGDIDGEEVVQVYVKSLDDPDAPIKSLKGFKRVPVAAGKTVKVTVDLSPEAFDFYDESIDELSFRKGNYRILYGSSSRDCDLKSIDLKVK